MYIGDKARGVRVLAVSRLLSDDEDAFELFLQKQNLELFSLSRAHSLPARTHPRTPRDPALLALALRAGMLADSLILAPPQFWHLLLLADAGAPAILAHAPLAVMLADAGAPAVLAGAPDAAMLAVARAPAVLAVIAWAPLAVMLAGAGAPAVPASAFAAVMLTDAGGGDGAGAGAREAARQVPRVPRGTG